MVRVSYCKLIGHLKIEYLFPLIFSSFLRCCHLFKVCKQALLEKEKDAKKSLIYRDPINTLCCD